MIEEVNALNDNGTWDLVSLPIRKKIIKCKWAFAIKVDPDGSIARSKAHLVVKGYAQMYGVDYFHTFSPVAKLTSARLFISIAASQD
ncbi:gag-pol polyprotein [Cucumis melo var. makuwa]|uniref:Gag-pol polyprotein n=1 Tax=Cucumis melo var. makuwa TaxID=1194695 RepID=A0A5A7UIG0_CUCMM|nr:gag-pol polyprotein [Cucumis melo var. makuwa]TYK22743.1 gag-pol polyprotein [Cucumis melo var. makuwa]